MKKSEFNLVDLLAEIVKKCYIISTMSRADVFFEYSPHCNSYDINFHKDGWKTQKTAAHINFCTDITIDNLNRSILRLNELAKDLGVNHV